MSYHAAVVLVACLSCTWVSAQPVILVTEMEAKASEAAGGMLIPRVTPTPGAPRITVVTPDISKPVSAPTSIEVKFVSNPPAEPKPESFRAMYGAFRIDVTERLLGVTRVTKDGFRVTNAVLPAGRHQLLLSLTDSMGRQAQQVLAFTVE